jgi:prevent-host-death family protein
MRVNVLEAKSRLSELIRAVQAGEEVVISNRGKPVARLVAEGGKAVNKARPGSVEAILGYLDSRPPVPGPRLTPEEIDALIEDNRNAWD